MLDQRKVLAIELLVDGTLSKTDVAKKVGISRTALYDWMVEPEFKAELDKRLQGFKSLCEKIIDTKLQDAIDALWELQQTTDNSRTKSDILRYFVDRALGKPTTKLDIEAGMKEPNKVSEDVLEAEFNEWGTEGEE